MTSNFTRSFGSLLTALLLTHAVYSKTPAGKGNHTAGHRWYYARQEEGVIGRATGSGADNPSDNLFHVYLKTPLQGNERVYLSYELDGVQDYTAVSRAVNDQLSVGGYLVKKRQGWARQRERVSAAWLRQGDNVIRFTVPEGAGYSYKVKNLAVEVEAVQAATPAVVIERPSLTYYNNKGYIKGFVSGAGKDKVTVRVGGKAARSWKGVFEAIVERPDSAGATWRSTVEVQYPDGRVKQQQVQFAGEQKADYQFELTNAVEHTQKFFTQQQAGSLAVGGASITIPKGALRSAATVSVTVLRPIDIPALDAGMVNLTRGAGGFRFLPHGTLFVKDAWLALDYDDSKIPDGYTEKDIRTYYFDEQKGHWIALPSDSVSVRTGKSFSRTRHFTDMINAVIKVPESPQAEAYNSTSMKGIKAANPSAAINMINPPKASNTGNASLSYPIELPAGRAGMQPQLSIGYNSVGSNGWLGMGWDLPLPFIGIDTRWGVPRFDGQNETETYTMMGEQLNPVAHRGTLQARTSEKQFFPRVEGAFDKIIRHGNSPQAYWWEVTDKQGTRHFYGGDPATGVDAASTLSDAAGNIAHWALRETRDLHGNFIHYTYAKVSDAGVSGGSVPGVQLYISQISYTGYNGTEGKYTVLFQRDRDLNGHTSRKDVTITATNGFKEVTADLLKRIDVQYAGSEVRHYELTYKEGAFYKTLLATISQYDAAGIFFNQHSFDYYNDIGSGTALIPLAIPQNWVVGPDNVHGGMLTHLNGFTDEASAISGTSTSDLSAGVGIAVGFDANVMSKENSVGASFGYSQSTSKGMLAMIDINGDGLPDKLFLDAGSNSLYYRPNLSGTTGKTGFGDKIGINGINVFQKDKTTGYTVGLEADAPGPFGIMAGANTGWSTTTTTIYFTEANGDQLLDIVKDGQVYFNHIDTTTGQITFTPTSVGTPSAIFAGVRISSNLVDQTQLEAERQQAIDNNPLQDIVRMWQAPYSGTINVTAPVQLLPSNDPERASTPADGVRIAVQLREAELWSQTIGPDDYSIHQPAGLTGLSVQKGDRIYFRVGSIDNGSYDSVNWAPVIEYANQDPQVADANGKPLYHFEAAKDFILSSPQTVTPPVSGQVRISGNFVKPVTTDDVMLVILHTSAAGTDTVWRQTYPGGQAVNTNIVLDNVAVVSTDQYSFKVVASTNIDWAAISWLPVMTVTSASDPNIQLGSTPIQAYAVPEFTILASVLQPSAPYKVLFGDVTAHPITVTPALTLGPGAGTGQIIFSVKKSGVLLGKVTMPVQNGSTAPGNYALNVSVSNGDALYVEYHVSDLSVAGAIAGANASITGDLTAQVTAGLFAPVQKNGKEEDIIFGSFYRGWGQFAWNGNRAFATQPIDESLLKPSDQIQQKQQQGTDPSALSLLNGNQLTPSQTYDPKQDRFIILIAAGNKQRWGGYDPVIFVKGANMNSSRMGQKDLSPLTINTGDGTGSPGIDKVSKVTSLSFTAGAGIGGIGGSASISNSTSRALTDFMDMNGDRYPDVVSQNIIQYTDARGGLSNRTTPNGSIQETGSSTTGVTLTGSASIPTSVFRNTPTGDRHADAGNAQTNAGSASISVSGSLGVVNGSNQSNFAYVDMNGDGLPDRVNQSNYKVALNLGYGFAGEEDWGVEQIQSGASHSFSGGVGLGFMTGHKSFAIGFSLSRSENGNDIVLQDMNGDGLPDLVKVVASLPGTQQALEVRLNTGNGFSPDVLNWSGASALNANSSTTESANLAFTVGFPLFGLKFIINASADLGDGMSRELVKMQDVNGDGYPDYISSTKDDNLAVSLSTIGRTNLLQRVHRPMGAFFTLDYQRTGNTYAMPNSVWTMASVTTFDGFGGDGPDTLLTTFQYAGGYFDRDEREFYGFKTVQTQSHDAAHNNTVYSTATETISNDNYYTKGLVLSSLVAGGDGKKYSEQVNTYELHDITTGMVLPDSYKTNDAGAAFVALSRTDHRFYEGQPQPGKTTYLTYGYDPKGNVSQFTDFGDDGPDDDISAAIAYYNVPDKYILSEPKSILVTGSGKTYRKRESTIDPQTGDVQQIRQYLENGSAAVTDMGYDGYGNLINITGAANAKGQRFRLDYTFDDQVHSHIVKATNSYGYSSQATFDYRFGELLSNQDLNGNSITYALDDLGRVIRITGPYELASGAPYTLRFDYHPDAVVPWARTFHYDPAHPGNDLETVTFTDGLGRVLQTKKDGALFQGQGKNDKEQMIVSGRVLFDGLGRQAAAYYPVLEDQGTDSLFNKTFDKVTPSLTTYDVLSRVLSAILPDGAVAQSVFGFDKDRQQQTQFSAKTQDPNGNISEQFTNIRGLVTSSKIYTEKGDIWSSFTYDAVNQEMSATDDMGAVTLSQYDMLGRRNRRQHPDEGLSQYSYDLAGNITRLVTANLQKDSTAITYSYDFNRVTDISYPHNPENNVHYTYGAAGVPNNRAGRIVVQEDATGAQEFFYGPLGETLKNVRTIVIPKFGQRTYVTQWTYDTWNRLTSMIYPDSEVITYNYNLGGLLQSMSGGGVGQDFTYVKQLGYDQFEQRVFLAYGNGTQTSYTYEPDRRRLQNMVATTGKGRRIMDNLYAYDKVNNILSLTNNAPVPSSNLMGGSSQYNYTYDDLYRLTAATGSYKGPHEQNRYSLQMEYNSVGSITRKTQTSDKTNEPGGNKWIPQKKTTYDLSYTYGPQQPHAVTHIGNQTYTYDADGNQTGWTDDLTGQRQNLIWDEDNRLRSVSVNGQLNSYVYDAGGERVLKGQGSGQAVYVNGDLKAGSGGPGNFTVYVNPYLVVRSGEYSKHYFIESQRITTRLEQGWQQQVSAKAAGDTIPFTKKEQLLFQGIARDQQAVQGAGQPQVTAVAGPDARGVESSNGRAGGNGNGTTGGSPDSSNNGNHYAYGHYKGHNDTTNQTFLYFYHPDHLGSTSYVTDDAGEVYEHMEYFAFGETFVQEHSNTDRIPYLFNGKELDEETGLYYYGSRYMDPRTSLWLSVDRYAEKYPGVSAYAYCLNNPIKLSDPTGDTIDVTTKGGKFLFSLDDKSKTKTTLTAKQLYDKGVQWFEPLADNYMPIINMNDKIGEMSELKHFTWEDIDQFSSEDRWMVSYRQGGSGDWKAKGKPGDGYLMVTIGGQPYWTDAVGQIPFALDYFTDRLEKHGDAKKAIMETIQKGREYGEGKVFGGKTDNSNAYDIYFVLRGALYGSHKYQSTKSGLKPVTPAADPKTLGGRIWYRDAMPYLGLKPKK